LAWPSEGSLGIDYPFLAHGPEQHLVVSAGARHGRKLAVELELALMIKLLKPSTELSSKHF
jgi:hypothetical protein